MNDRSNGNSMQVSFDIWKIILLVHASTMLKGEYKVIENHRKISEKTPHFP
jgi:hypothetical protein